MRLRSLVLSAALAGGAMLYTPDARACGGCFPPPGEQASVVTDHRMILSVGKTQSTLYDQIRYSGNPKEFAWILPISGEVEVGLSADSLFGGLDTLTSVVVQEPPRNCPPEPEACRRERDEKSASAGGGFQDAGSGVSVIKTEVVGPYETVQLHPETENDVAALEGWLAEHGFNVPDDIKPVIAEYVKEHFDFLALRLQPGEGVGSMRPVRVTTQGANVALPLRMVAAGTGANVGITLWIVAEGRYQPTNFNSFIVADDDLTWDWASGTSDFKSVRQQKQAADAGKLWEIESSISTSQGQIQNAAAFQSGFGGVEGDYIEFKDPKTQATIDPRQAQQADFETLFAGVGQGFGDVRVTRLRADLAHASLATDLTVGASTDQSELPRTRNPLRENGQPQCPVYSGCEQTGTLPRDQAQAAASNAAAGDDDAGCSTTTKGRSGAGLSVVLGFVAVALGRVVRRRRQR